MKDLFGNTIRVGDYIAYPEGRHGDFLSIALVLGVEEQRLKLRSMAVYHFTLPRDWSTPRIVYITRIDRAVILGCSVPDEVKTLLD